MRRRPKAKVFAHRARREDVAPYAVLARYYDEVMSHVQYRRWAGYLDKLARKHGVRGQRVMDFACGTGSLLWEFARNGWQTYGVDGSAPMIDAARKIVPPVGATMEWAVVDFLSAHEVDEPFPLGVCVYDSLNYLLDPDEVGRFFRNARPAIASDGVLIFDLSTELNSRMHFDGSVLEEQVRGGAYRRITRYDEDERIQHNVFNIYPEGEDVVYVEHHQQRIYSIADVLDIADDNGFCPVSVYHEMTMTRGDETSDRVHIVAEPR